MHFAWSSSRVIFPCALAVVNVSRLGGPFHCQGPLPKRNTEKQHDPLRHRFENLQSRGLATEPRTPAWFGPKKTKVVRVALTGGPCGGKSSALAAMLEDCKAAGFDVYCAPETATILFNSGVQFPAGRPEGIFKFQSALIRMQLQVERSLTNIAEETGRPSIIIFDRGVMDIKGYIDEKDWVRLLQVVGGNDKRETGISEEYILERYDMVVHMVTAADGCEQVYKWGKTVDDNGNVVIRGETPEEARALDKKMQDVWQRHQLHFIIDNDPSDCSPEAFRKKCKKAADKVLAVAKIKHPDLP